MSIPIDKLYHYIESIAKDIRGDNVLIYRFYPHGSKKLEDLAPIRSFNFFETSNLPPIYCYDQEPLDYDRYEHTQYYKDTNLIRLQNKYQIPNRPKNIRSGLMNVYDPSILIHSEKRSRNLDLYLNNNFIPVYYWSHGIIALDWYRYAKYEKINKTVTKTFLIYNRAWSGSREYRLKFVDLLIQHKLIDCCCITVNPIEPELGIHYNQHAYVNKEWIPNHLLEHYVPKMSTATSSASADYEIADYNSTDFEIVLETLFDDDRIQLTEKILRPIAMGQPFLLASTHGSLEYLRSYGFRTFSSVIDESYDNINDPKTRLETIVKTMKEISNWTAEERKEKMLLANKIATYNRKHFFSNKFFSQVTDELKTNLQAGLARLEEVNTSHNFIAKRKELAPYKEIVDYLLGLTSREDTLSLIIKAKQYSKNHSTKY